MSQWSCQAHPKSQMNWSRLQTQMRSPLLPETFQGEAMVGAAQEMTEVFAEEMQLAMLPEVAE